MKTATILIALGVAGLIYVPASLAVLYFQTWSEMSRSGGKEWTMEYFSDYLSAFRLVLIPLISLGFIVAGILLKRLKTKMIGMGIR